MRKYIICFLFLLCISAGIAGYFMMNGRDGLSKDEKRCIKEAEEVTTKEVTRASTKLIAQVYDERSEKVEKDIKTLPASFLGLTRLELIKKLKDYMQEMPVDELNKGLVNYELLYFSPEYVMTRKTYHLPPDFQKYYVCYNRGCLTVYYSDRKTVYEYTDLKLDELPEDLQARAISGFTIKDDASLYDFLQAYSS